MKVICLSNQGKDLPLDCRDPRLNITDDTTFPLKIGEEYIVYAMTVFLCHIWYYICDENYSYYPVWHPSPLFKVSDSRISSHWEYGYFGGESARETYPIFAFKEWSSDLYYYDRLTDGVEKDIEVFNYYKHLMDAEFG
jgi:hypothetical protein